MDTEPVYVTYDEMHADRIRGILAGQGIACAVRSMRVGGYEGIRVGPLGEIHILVAAPYAAKARRLIQDAIRDGALWPLGAPIGGEDPDGEAPDTRRRWRAAG